ncbi:hypothetical protein EVAR_100075_1 [Eumeta japonica]|uniref:Peptidase A2 domain-containing protein n=1 Tax=Eumeta variegata TaxID=151549 RepID=A0A4C1YVP1_EUMVA|nr:hypothetical protein EVAR_100075_1 [Eumeta japonica]
MELREIRAAKALAKTDRALGQLYDDEECLDTCHETVEIPTDRSRTTFESQTADETAGIRERGQTNTSDQKPAPPKYLHELPNFYGEINEWIAFRTVYRDTQCHFTESQNVARLRKALKGDARENVKSLLYSGASADDILDSLQRYFGRPEILILNELENIKKMPKLAEDGRNMNVFASKIVNCVASIKALEKPQYLYSPELVNKIVDKLNLYMKYKWFEFNAHCNQNEPDMLKISRFLQEMNDQCGYMNSCETRKEDRFIKRNEFKRRPTNATAIRHDSDVDNDNENRHREPRVETTAIITNDERRRTFDKNTLPIDERWERAKKAHVCFRCLSNTHYRSECRARPCGKDGCKKTHHKLLHQDRASTDETNGQISSINVLLKKERVFLKIIPVEISGPLGRLETYALLDEGSTTTLIERDVALKIAPPGKHETLRIEGVGGKRLDYDESFRLKVKIKGKFERNIESMNALVIDKLQLAPQTIDLDTVRQYSHLHELEDELSYEKARPTILIGQDNWHLIVSREVVQRTEINRPLRTLNWDGYCTAGERHRPPGTRDQLYRARTVGGR